MALVSQSSGVSQLQAHLFCCSPSFLPLGGGLCRGVARCCLARVALPVVMLQVVELQGYGGAARLCRCCALVRAEHVVLLQSLARVPLTFLEPLPDTELLPYVLSSLFLWLCPFCSQELLLCYSLAGCNAKKGNINGFQCFQRQPTSRAAPRVGPRA